jgi:excisionase family DNA binding protein
MPKDPEKFYRIEEVAEILCVTDRTVRRWIREKGLAVHEIGRLRRVGGSDLKAFLKKHRRTRDSLRESEVSNPVGKTRFMDGSAINTFSIPDIPAGTGQDRS